MKHRILSVVVVLVAVLALGASGAQARPVLTVHRARAIFRTAEPAGRFHGCGRESARKLLCRVEVREVAIHEWEDPATGEWQEAGRVEYFVSGLVPIYPGGVAWAEALA